MPAVSVLEIKAQIALNTAEIVRLKSRIDETVPHRSRNDADRKAWQEACAEFHQRYNHLAFPGGYNEALEKFRVGEVSVVEPALCFLEVRPYFFRSGYMFQVLMRRVKRAPMTDSQRARLLEVLQRRAAWKARKGRLEQEQGGG